MVISQLQSVWLQEPVDSYPSDPATAKILATLTAQGPYGHFTLHQGVIKYKGRVWVGANSSIQLKILQSLHSSPLVGHSIFPITYKRIQSLFAWPNLKSMVKEYVAHCENICQQAKTKRVKYPGLLQRLPVLDYAWQVVSLHFI
jgi:hypothetical protein